MDPPWRIRERQLRGCAPSSKLAAVNVGHQSAYGDDVATDQARTLVRGHLAGAEFFPVFTRTGANVVALTVNHRWQSVICAPCPFTSMRAEHPNRWRHEAGTVPTADGKLRPDDVQGQCFDMELFTVPNPAPCITQSSEMHRIRRTRSRLLRR